MFFDEFLVSAGMFMTRNNLPVSQPNPYQIKTVKFLVRDDNVCTLS